MKQNISLSIIVASACACGLVSSAEARCSNATLMGRYVFHTDGIVLPGGTRRVNLAVITFDGQGNFTNRFTVNDNGVVTRGVLTSTYQVNADCRGTTGTGGDLVVLENGEEFFTIPAITGGSVLNLGFGKRLGHGRDDDNDHDGDEQ